ncbi:UPF0764 protein C16orf89 homolog [Amphiura filiformis]|uniref:UPF0764 protein C16orf89 homolog n=1 Tax=Amphiura filiformis TaxID=82378 RepID=UPI003B20D259
MKKSWFLYLHTLTLVNCLTINNGETKSLNRCNDIVTRVLRAVEKTTGFFSREYENVNLDALLGLRMAEGQLIGFLQTFVDNQNVGKVAVFDSDIIDKVDNVRQETDDICDRAIPHVKRNYPQDYDHLGKLVTTDGFWDTNADPRLINKRFPVQPPSHSNSELLKEKTTDDCFAELLGSSKSSQGSCSTSKRCWDLMSAPGYDGYSLTHQILYFQIGLKMQCTPTLKKRFYGHRNGQQFSPMTIFDELCAKEFHEAEGIAANGFPLNKQDLFLEQGLLCGLLGYQDFYRKDWLAEILSWQDESGCFKNKDYVKAASKMDVTKNREKRREKIVTVDGCLSHKTSVALGFLSTYLRLLLDILPDCFTTS